MVKIFPLLFILILPISAVAVDLTFPPLTGRVVDNADVLSPITEEILTNQLAELEEKNSTQLVVVTLPNLQGVTIEDYGYQLGRFWGIGLREKDNGALLIIAPNDRAVRIEVGYGLEGDLTDAASRMIIEHKILPHFRLGDFDKGVSEGVNGIISTISSANECRETGDCKESQQDSVAALLPVAFIILIFMFMLLNRRRSLITPLILGGGIPRRHGWHSIDSGGGFGGGGFSGGGGSFGGGGASGRW